MIENSSRLPESLRKTWWIGLVIGIAFVIYGLMVLSLRPTTVLSLAVLAGFAFILGGVEQFVVARRTTEWAWLFYVGGALGIAAGIGALVWPGATLFVLSVFVAWYLVIGGVFAVVGALTGPKHDWWWMGIVLGALQFVLGLWAIASPGRELLLLINLVGFYLVFAGFTEVLLSLSIRKSARDTEQVASHG